jgi:ribonuclease J
LVLDCGFDLGVDLPGINYAIPAIDYLHSIRHKLRGYVISHGHMDHVAGLPHVVPECPAPIYGSPFTIGMVQKQFDGAADAGLDFTPECVTMNMDTHERLKIGVFMVELVRVTHSVPESSAIVVDTPVGRLINTGDFRLDPEPLDDKPSDIARLKKLGGEGVLLLMSESTNTTRLGRTPTEHTLQESYYDLIGKAPGRVFVGVFSTNMNRVQMIINAAAEYGRKVAFDGRSMIATAELAVRLGNSKIPKGTLVPMREAPNVPKDRLVVVCTGGQGEPNAAMQRMSVGEHQYIKLRRGDTVVISSTPIPGNEVRYQQVGDDLIQKGVHLYRHPTHEIDGCGPLHAEMIHLTRPKYMLPIYGGALARKYHQDVALQEGVPRKNIIMANNGDVIELGAQAWPRVVGQVTAGSVLVDQTGAIVPGVVTKDRLMLQGDGIVVVILTVNKSSGRPLTSPDVISRGFIYLRDNAELIEGLRAEIRKFTAKHRPQQRTLDAYKKELRDVAAAYLHKHTNRLPLIVPVVNIIQAGGKGNVRSKPVAEVC